MTGKQQRYVTGKKKDRVRPRRFLAVFMCLAMITGLLTGIGPLTGRTAKAAEQAVTTAAAGNAASGVKITHSVTMPSSGGKTATITVEIDSELQIKKQSDTVFVVDCSATAELARQKTVLKSLAAMILKNANCGANRFGLVSFSNDAEIMTEFTGDYDTFVAAVDRCQAQGNINYYAGMKLAGEMLADKGAESSENSMVVVGRGVCNMNSAKAVQLADELRGKQAIYGLCTSVEAAESSGILKQIAGDNFLKLGGGADDFRLSSTQLAARLVDSPLYQNFTVEGSLTDKFVQRSLVSCLYVPRFNSKVTADFTEGRLKVTAPEFYAGESMRITLTADIRDRLAMGVIPVTGAVCLRADNLAEVSADALSIERSGYTVTYEANGGSGSVPVDPNLYMEGTEVKVKAKPADLKKDGANFSGWALSTGGTLADGSFTMPVGGVSLRALWGRAYIQKKTNTVILNTKPTKRMKSKNAIGTTSAFYDSTYQKNIRSVTFLNTNQMPEGGVQTWDITDTDFGDAGSVLATVVLDADTQKYDLYIGAEGGVEAPEDSSSLFSDFTGLTGIQGLEYFDTSNVTSMRSMFHACRKLTTLDVSNFDTSKVTDMYYMFYECSGLTTLDVSNFDTSNVTDMDRMFSDCSGLTALNVSNFDTSKVTDMYYMFYSCSGLTTLDVSNFDTSNLTSTNSMFRRCSGLKTLDLGDFNTSNVTRMDLMFCDCSGLTTLDVSGFDTSKVGDMSSMFRRCSGLTTLNVSGFDTSNVSGMGSMFGVCSGLTTLDVSGFDTSKVKDMSSMFTLCSGLTTLDVSGFNTSKVTKMGSMFSSCSALTSIGVTELTVADGCNISSWRKKADKLPDDIVIKSVSGIQLWPESTYSLRTSSMNAPAAAGEAVFLPAADEREEEPESCGAEPMVQNLGNTALRSDSSDGAPMYANEKNGMIEGGKLTAGQEVEYVLELQYIGDEGGKSGELLVTDRIPDGMTYQKDSVVVSSVARIDGGSGNLSGKVTKQPEVKDGILSFTVEGLSAGAKLKVTYKCKAPAAEPAQYTEYINTASVNDSGLLDESDPVRHYMSTRPNTFYNITYQYTGSVPDGAAVPGSESVAAGRTVSLPQPQARGWTFNGWKAGGTKVSDSYTPQQDTVLAGSWTKEQEPETEYIQIKYQFSGDVPENASVILSDIKEEAEEKAGVNERVSLPDKPELPAGYAGFEWKLPEGIEVDENGWYCVGESGKFADDTIEVTGIWTKKQYQVTYQYDGDVPLGAAAVPASQSYKWGGKVSLASAPADTETHTFAGWTGVSADAAGQFEMPMEDITITGRWMEKSIKINPNGGLWKESGDETVYSYQSYLRDKENGSFPDASREKYIFEGWEESEDSEGNFVKVLTAKWTDKAVPVIGTLTYSYALNQFGPWLIGKDTLTITVPVTAEGNEVEKVTYTLTPEGGAASTYTAPVTNGEAVIAIPADFKGTIDITCTDKAGNTSAGVTVGAGQNASGIIIENHAPQVECKVNNNAVSADAYESAPDIVVTVMDDKDNAISCGIASVTYQIGNNSVKTVDHDYTTSMVTNDSFTIPASEIPAGETVITVTVTDNAGNTKTFRQTIRVKTDAEKVEDAKKIVEKTLADYIATNYTKKENIQSVLDAALTKAGITEVTVTVGSLTKKNATKEAAGSVSASISITKGSASASVTMNKTINKLPAQEKPDTTGSNEGSTGKNALSLNAKLKATQTGNKITIEWGKVAGADGYDVYVQYCGRKFTKKSIHSVKGNKVTKLSVKKVNGKELNLKKITKVYVRAYRLSGSKNITLGKSITVHVAGRKNTKYTNVKAVKVKKSSYTLKIGKTAAIKASTVLVSKGRKQLSDAHAKEFRYATSDKKVAAVSKTGKIKAAGKGTCTIYVYARNGYAKKIKVTVK